MILSTTSPTSSAISRRTVFSRFSPKNYKGDNQVFTRQKAYIQNPNIHYNELYFDWFLIPYPVQWSRQYRSTCLSDGVVVEPKPKLNKASTSFIPHLFENDQYNMQLRNYAQIIRATNRSFISIINNPGNGDWARRWIVMNLLRITRFRAHFKSSWDIFYQRTRTRRTILEWFLPFE